MQTLLLIAVLLPLAAAVVPAGGPAVAMAGTGGRVPSLALAAAAGRTLPTGPTTSPDRRGMARRGGRAARRPFSLALDGLSLWLFGLTALLLVVAVLVGWDAIDGNSRSTTGCCWCWRRACWASSSPATSSSSTCSSSSRWSHCSS